jgi:hypothetical protein
VAKNLGRRTLGSIDFYTETPEEAAQGLLDALKPWWENKLKWQSASADVMGEALCDEIDAAADDAAKPNSPEQAEAGNYQKGHCSLHGLQIAIENAKGSTRSGTGDDGSTWTVTMPAHYGYIKGTQGKDKDHIDVYIGPKPDGFLIFVVNQNTKGGKFDEHKCMFGFESKDEAIKCYDKAFSGDLGPKLRASVVSTTVDKFKAWLEGGNHKKPFENVSESIVTEMLDSELKDFAGEVPMRQTFGDLQPGDVVQVHGGDGPIYQIVGRFYDQMGTYRRSFLGLDHKHNQAMNPGTAVEYIEYCPSLAYGEFDRRSAAAAEEPFNSEVKYLGTTDEWTPERIWAHVKETGERNRRGNAQDYNRNNPDDPNNPYGPHDGPAPPPRHVPRRRPPQPPLRRE